jgi:hypothetical protein
MSDVKIVFSNIVGEQIQGLVTQLKNDRVLSIGDISVCVDSFDRTDYYELTVYGQVMEKPMSNGTCS